MSIKRRSELSDLIDKTRIFLFAPQGKLDGEGQVHCASAHALHWTPIGCQNASGHRRGNVLRIYDTSWWYSLISSERNLTKKCRLDVLNNVIYLFVSLHTS
jgi:hypothetical protein